jgi:hypothetical protein
VKEALYLISYLTAQHPVTTGIAIGTIAAATGFATFTALRTFNPAVITALAKKTRGPRESERSNETMEREDLIILPYPAPEDDISVPESVDTSDRRLNRMLLQLQGEVGGHNTHSVSAINTPDPGVTVSQIGDAAFVLYQTTPNWFPNKHKKKGALAAALGEIIKATEKYRKNGGVTMGGNIRTAQWDDSDPKGANLRSANNRQSIREPGDYRVDLENKRGHNLLR